MTVERRRRGAVVEGSEGESSEMVESPEGTRFAGVPAAMVEYRTGVTLNMGNYESARVEVGIVLPAKASPPSIDKVFAFGREWAEEKIEAEVERLMGKRG